MNAIATPPSPTLVQALAQHLIQWIHLPPALAVVTAFGVVMLGWITAIALLMCVATAIHCARYRRQLRREARRSRSAARPTWPF